MGLFGRPTTTLILVEPDQVARADFAGPDRRLVSCKTAARSPGRDLTTTVEWLTHEPRATGRVWVLSSDFWSQQVAIATPMLSGLTEDEKSRTLAFEVESLSGVGALESDLQFVRLGEVDGFSQFWVTQVPWEVRDRLNDAVRASGGRLLGLVHPSLPTTLAATLLGAGSPDMTVPRRLDEESAGAWLSRWAELLDRDNRGLPVVRPPVQPVTGATWLTLAAALGITLAAIAISDYRQLTRATTEARAQAKRLRDVAKQVQEAANESTKIELQHRAVAAAGAQIEREIATAKAEMVAHRERWSRLLRFIAERATDDLVVQRVTNTNGLPTLEGRCLGGEVVTALARDLEAELRPLGWSVTTKLTADGASDSYEFSIQLRDSPRGT